MQRTDLIKRLGMLRKTARRRLLVYGMFACLGGAIAAFLAIVALDWILWLPAALRVIVAILFVAGVTGAVLYWIVAPARASFGIDEIAARLERRFPLLQDRLSSAVSFLQHGDGGSPSMMRQAVANTEETVRRLSLESALSLRPLSMCLALFLVSATSLVVVSTTLPQWLQTGLCRYTYPLSSVEWPRRVLVIPLTGTEIVALGESVTVRMKIERGLSRGLRGVVHFGEVGGETSSLAMQGDGDGTFYATIDAVTTNLEYWFEAGDDSTERNPSLIKVVRRPEVTEALVEVEPPPYAVRRVVRTEDLRDGPVSAPLGGHVTVSVRASKPIFTDAPGGTAGLRLETGELIPLSPHHDDPPYLSTRFEVTGDVPFRIELRDEYGFENRRAVRHSINAVCDRTPIVSIVEPTSVTELTPRGSVRLVIRAEDDFGLAGLSLNIGRLADGQTYTIDLTDRLVVVDDAEGVEAAAEYVWSIAPMRLTPPEVLTYLAEVTDNRVTADLTGQVGRSAPLRVKVISDIEFDLRIRDELVLLEDRLRRVLLDEADLLDRTSGLLRADPEPAVLTQLEREQAAVLAGGQSRLVRRTRDLSRRFATIVVRMEANLSGGEEARRRMAALRNALRQVAAGPMTSAAGSLLGVAEQSEAPAQQLALREAARDEEIAVDSLRTLIRSVSQWGDFQGLVTRTRDLHDRQNEIRTETGALGKSILGKQVTTLTTDQAAALTRIRRQQEQLAVDVEQLLSRMRQMVDTAGEKDPSGAEAVESAIRVARGRDLVKRVHAAARAIDDNRTAAATIDQKAAAEAMRKMTAALQQREIRELARLHKMLEQAESQVAALIEEQQALRTATHEADSVGADEIAYASLTEQQRALRRNTRATGRELEADARTAPAAQVVRSAAVPMRKAEAELGEAAPAPATAAQDEALTLLEEARERLAALAQTLAEQALRVSLAHINDGLESMLSAQRDINERIGKLRAAIEERGRMGRLQAREATKLARAQAELRRWVDQWLPDFEQVPIYEWALRRVAGWMDQSRQWLDTRRVDEELASTTARIVRELERLIGAIAELDSLPTDQAFAEAGGGGSGRGRTMTSKPVPTIAELLVLKAMQKEINNRTRLFDQSFDMQDVGEEQLRELKMLGEDQAEISRLTELVTREARRP